MVRTSARSGAVGSGASILTRSRPGAVSEDVARLLEPQKARKYHNQPVEVDGVRFDSKREAERYGELVRAVQAGAIRSLEVHPRFPLVIHGIDTGDYVADFSYLTADGVAVVEDVKSAPTRKLPTYRLKRRQVWALYAVEIREV